ncbi:MAG: CPBP family intramembrane metalloprotease [Saprospiraceae bacterium]|nr:CPBP family intramembrane metalloprotease [Saprospiraceae bacterium]|tara:strand:+ start:2849 stop:3751 length:903 start_codon:yes stop_codon:yes gene_type:complete
MNSNNQQSVLSQLGTLLFLVVLFTLLGQGLTFLLLKMGGMTVGPEMLENLEGSNQRQWIRLATAIGHIISFTLSSLLFLYLFHRSTYSKFLKSNVIPQNGLLWMCLILLIVAYPIVIKLSEWNMLLPLPDWAVNSSEHTEALLKGILQMDGISELLMSIFLVGITPAIGEELLYRGIVQNKFIKHTGNEHIGIFIASFLFSLNHLQLERLLPFMMLGLVLGYSYHYTKSFWVPVLLHFINNSFQVVALYGNQDMISELDLNNPPQLPIYGLILSIFATLAIIIYLKKKASASTYEQELTA